MAIYEAHPKALGDAMLLDQCPETTYTLTGRADVG